MNERLITKLDFERITKINRRTIDRMRRADLLPAPLFVGCGTRRRVRWRETDVALWLQLGCPARHDFERQRDGAPVTP